MNIGTWICGRFEEEERDLGNFGMHTEDREAFDEVFGDNFPGDALERLEEYRQRETNAMRGDD